jgi:hypothetical protein
VKTRSIISTIAVAIIGVTMVAAPASAYYITGWQTNGGWNHIDGCNVNRGINNTRVSTFIDAWDLGCKRDVGVRGKGTKDNGTYFENSGVSWSATYAQRFVDSDWTYTAMKVYHGNH